MGGASAVRNKGEELQAIASAGVRCRPKAVVRPMPHARFTL